MKHIFICGSALRGQPDHQNLKGAKLVREAQTQPKYRLHSVENGWHPGIYEVEADGVSIPGEVYEMSEEQYQYLLDNEPPHMYPATVELENGDSSAGDKPQRAIAMLYPQELIEQHNWPDISHLGGWAAYKSKTG